MEQIKKDLSETRTDVRLLVNKVDANHESLRKTITRIEEMLEKQNKTLYGNGVEGLTTKVSKLEDLKKDFDKHAENDRHSFLALGSVLVTILLGVTKLVFFK